MSRLLVFSFACSFFPCSVMADYQVIGGDYFCKARHCVIAKAPVGTKLALVSGEHNKICRTKVSKVTKTDEDEVLGSFTVGELEKAKDCDKAYDVAVKDQGQKVEKLDLQRLPELPQKDLAAIFLKSALVTKFSEYFEKASDKKTPQVTYYTIQKDKKPVDGKFIAQLTSKNGGAFFYYLNGKVICPVVERSVAEKDFGIFSDGEKLRFFGQKNCLLGGCGDVPVFLFDLETCKELWSDCTLCT